MSRNFCLTVYPTINEKEETSEIHLDPEAWNQDGLIRYFIYQIEMCPTTGRLHLQCYLETTRAVRFSALQKLEGLASAHIAARRGTREQAKHYCMKPVDGCNCLNCDEERKTPTKLEGPFEFGDWGSGGQGARNDLAEIHKQIKEGKSLKDICEQNPSSFIRYHRGIEKVKLMYSKPRDFKTHVVFYYGPTGWGKSHAANQRSSELYTKPTCNKYFDNYDGSMDAVIDDFKGWMPYTQLLAVMDKFGCMVDSKHGMVNFAAKNLYITSCVLPQNWYKDDVHFNWHEWARRVDEWWVADLGTKHKFLKSCKECFPHHCSLSENCVNKNA